MKFFDVPNFPGIPPMVRDPQAAATSFVVENAVSFASPIIGAARDLVGSVTGELKDVLGLGDDSGDEGSSPAAVWGLFNSDGEQVLFPDTFLGMEFRNARRISNYPLEQGAFESYNKVNDPFDIVVGMAVGGDLGNRSGFLDTCRELADDLELYTLVTPEEVFESVNVERYDYARKQQNGATLITVNLYLKEIRVNTTAEFTTSPETPVTTKDAAASTTVETSSAAQDSPTLAAEDVQNPASASPQSQGQVQPAPATPEQAAPAPATHAPPYPGGPTGGALTKLPEGYTQDRATGLIRGPDGQVDRQMTVNQGSNFIGNK